MYNGGNSIISSSADAMRTPLSSCRKNIALPRGSGGPDSSSAASASRALLVITPSVVVGGAEGRLRNGVGAKTDTDFEPAI